MHCTVSRITRVLATMAMSVGALACNATSGNSAADVSGDDVRRLPPDRLGSVPDIILEKADHGRTLGSDSARVTMLVVSDYQCSACRTWFDSTLPVIRADYLDRGTVRLVWVHYPLRKHPAAVHAASAALCASAQGKFWEASDRLFNMKALRDENAKNDAVLKSLSDVPGLDSYMLASCTETNRMFRQIRHDIDWADTNRIGVPLSLSVGGRKIPDGTPLAALRTILDSAVAHR